MPMPCQTLFYAGLGEERKCEQPAVAILDIGKPHAQPLCQDCAQAAHPTRLTLLADPPAAPTCKHPPHRLFTWWANDDTLCIGCCACGQILAGAVDLDQDIIPRSTAERE